MIYLRNVKRIVALFMTLIMVLCCFIACNSSSEEKGCNHNIVIDQAKEATCTATGLTLGKHCSKCGEILVAQETISKKSHEIVNDSAIAATCTSTGKTAGSHCRTCGLVTSSQEITPMIGHNYISGECSMCKTSVVIHDASNGLMYMGGTLEISNVENGYFSFKCYAMKNSGYEIFNQKIVGYDSKGNETFSDVVQTYYGGTLYSYIMYNRVPSTTVKIMVSDYN